MKPLTCFIVVFALIIVLADVDYELHFPSMEQGYLSLRSFTSMKEITICVWLQTNNSGFMIEYKTASLQKTSKGTGLEVGNNEVKITILGQKR